MRGGSLFCSFRRSALAIALQLALGGCVLDALVQAQTELRVTRNHALGGAAGDRSFAIVALPVAAQEGADFDRTAGAIARRLRGLGLHLADPDDADLLVTLFARSEALTYERPVYGDVVGEPFEITETLRDTEGNRRTVRRTVTPPPVYRQVGTRTVQDGRIHILVVQMHRRDEGGRFGDRLFLGKVSSAGRELHFREVADCLVAALFRDFPGRGSETFRLGYPPGGCARF